MRILIIDNQIIYPPEAGGPKRIFNIFSNLSREHRVNYVGVTGYLYLNKLNKKITDNFYEDTISLTKPFIILNNFFHNIVKSVPTFDIICHYFMFLNPRVKRRVKKLAKSSKVLISSHPWMFSVIKNYRNKVKVYDSHNCEYQLYKKFFRKNTLNNIFCNLIFRIEKTACRKSDLIFACSEGNKKSFIEYYKINPKKIIVIPNPIDIDGIIPVKNREKKYDYKKKLGLNNKKTILFIGSNFLPNIEAFNFIYNILVNQLQDYVFLVVGSISDYFYQITDDRLKNIELKNINIKGSGILGYGFHNLEKWGKEGFDVRWSKKEFNFFIKDKNITRIIMEVRSLKNITGDLYVNRKRIKKINFKTGIHFRKFEVPIGSLDSVSCTINLDRVNKPFLFDTRAVGIAIKSIKYLSNNKLKKINLNRSIIPYILPKNIKLFGRVSELKLREILAASDIAINPVVSGSGINIKMVDYMAAALPVVTTKVGARGFSMDRNDMMVSELKDFNNNIKYLFKNGKIYDKISGNARKTIAENFDAKKYGIMVSKILEGYVRRKNADSLPNK